MAYFDEAGIKTQETKEQNNIRLEDNSTSNDIVDESLLRQKLKNLVQKEFFHQLEPVEVLEIVSDQNKNKFGKIIGRYVYSEHNQPLNDCRESGAFIPLQSNNCNGSVFRVTSMEFLIASMFGSFDFIHIMSAICSLRISTFFSGTFCSTTLSLTEIL